MQEFTDKENFVPTHVFTLSDGRRLPMVIDRNECPENPSNQWYAFTRDSFENGYDPDAFADVPHTTWVWNYNDESVSVSVVEELPADLVTAARVAAVDNADAWVNCRPGESFVGDEEEFVSVHIETLDRYLQRASTKEERSLVWPFYMDETSAHVLDVLDVLDSEQEQELEEGAKVTPGVLRALVSAFVEAEPSDADPATREAFEFFARYHREHPYSTSAIENTALEGVRWAAQAIEAWVAREVKR